MTVDRREPSRPEPPAARAAAEGEPQPSASDRTLLRAVYPLNPGIPHFLDFPRDPK